MEKKSTINGPGQSVKGLEKELSEIEDTKERLKRSQENAWALLNAPPDWAVLIDPQGTILHINEVGAKRLGRSIDKLIGECIYDFFPLDVAKYRKKRIAEVMRSRKPLRFYDEPQDRVFDTNVYPILDEHDEVARIAIFAHEITAQKHTEEALRASEAQKKAILDASIDSIKLIDRDMKIIWANRAATEALNMSPDDIAGQYCFKIFALRDTPCPRCPVKKALRSGKTEHSLIHQTGDTYWDDYAVPVKDEAGNIVNLVQIARDITEIKNSEKILEDSTRELEISKKSLEEVNTALRVLVERRDEDKKELEERVLMNVKELVVPLLEKVKEGSLDSKQSAYLSVLESNLNDIISPFSRTLSSKHLGLTPTELRIANMIKEGKKTKEMARLMNLSPRTVESHREGIRKKIGIKNRRANLRSHLLSV
jgi:PAS domain S-box-containing protein